MKKKVFILTYYYVPGFKGGGPIQSIKNMVDNLSDEFEFFILTLDRDLGDMEPYRNIRYSEWQKVGNANVYYIYPDKLNFKNIYKLLRNTECDIIYINSFFGAKISIPTILINKFNLIKRKHIIIAPRGEFSPGALGLKTLKKKIYICLFKLFNLHKDIVWHATSKNEEEDIKNILGDNLNLRLSSNLTADTNNLTYDKNLTKKVGSLKIVFLSRITPKKNLIKAIKLLGYINGTVIFDIYGPKEDIEYWNECEKEISKLGKNVTVRYMGTVDNSDVNKIFKKYHIFLFPTLGENFGHVISEALLGGCPVVISDQTPWRDLEQKNVGWDIPIGEEVKFIDTIQRLIDMGKEEYTYLSMNAFNFGKEKSNSNNDIQRAKELFKL